MTDTIPYRHNLTLDRFRRSVSGFTERLAQVRDDQWHAPTPCSEWDVRALVNHVCSEQRWMAQLLDGHTIAEVGSRLDGDLLGGDPQEAWEDAVTETAKRIERPGILTEVVHLSSGPATVARYCDEVAADTLVHTWDLARAIGANERLPVDLVSEVLLIVEPWVTPTGVPGMLAPPLPVSEKADRQTILLAMLGRSTD
jgi:uncharacterized protein (TIGR03086 family)